MAVKQVIVVRKDLNMRKGKIAAQVAHASVGIVFDRLKQTQPGSPNFIMRMEAALYEWYSGAFTKVVVGCDSEKELRELYVRADNLGLPTKLIIDSGRTEFNGVPTATCVAIGPADEAEVDKVTGELKLI